MLSHSSPRKSHIAASRCDPRFPRATYGTAAPHLLPFNFFDPSVLDSYSYGNFNLADEVDALVNHRHPFSGIFQRRNHSLASGKLVATDIVPP